MFIFIPINVKKILCVEVWNNVIYLLLFIIIKSYGIVTK